MPKEKSFLGKDLIFKVLRTTPGLTAEQMADHVNALMDQEKMPDPRYTKQEAQSILHLMRRMDLVKASGATTQATWSLAW